MHKVKPYHHLRLRNFIRFFCYEFRWISSQAKQIKSHQPCWVNLRFVTTVRMCRNCDQLTELTIPLQSWPLSGVYSMSLATGQYEQCLNVFMAAQWAFKYSSVLPTVLNKNQANVFSHFLLSLIRSNNRPYRMVESAFTLSLLFPVAPSLKH